MALEWHWWMLPLVVFCLGAAWAHVEAKNSQPGGYFPDMGPPLIFIGTALVTLALIVGHFV